VLDVFPVDFHLLDVPVHHLVFRIQVFNDVVDFVDVNVASPLVFEDVLVASRLEVGRLILQRHERVKRFRLKFFGKFLWGCNRRIFCISFSVVWIFRCFNES